MRILILGGSGLIGHKLLQKLTHRFDDVHATLRGDAGRFEWTGLFDGPNIHENFNARDHEAVEQRLNGINPDVVLNCIGITKRRPEVNNPLNAISVNSLFPHWLARWAGERGKRVIHFSTDCVFDGAEGNYSEDSPTTGTDAYGQTKALGEIRYDHTLTIRSSFVGQELAVHSELLDWFLQQRGKTIKGFTDAWYSGISTIEMARIVGDIIEHHPDLNGLYQLSTAEPVSKYELLCLARESYDLEVEIIPDDSLSVRPTLDGTRLRREIGYTVPSWPQMMQGLASERDLYPQLS